jgi:hypothetical protein
MADPNHGRGDAQLCVPDFVTDPPYPGYRVLRQLVDQETRNPKRKNGTINQDNVRFNEAVRSLCDTMIKEDIGHLFEMDDLWRREEP